VTAAAAAEGLWGLAVAVVGLERRLAAAQARRLSYLLSFFLGAIVFLAASPLPSPTTMLRLSEAPQSTVSRLQQPSHPQQSKRRCRSDRRNSPLFPNREQLASTDRSESQRVVWPLPKSPTKMHVYKEVSNYVCERGIHHGVCLALKLWRPRSELPLIPNCDCRTRRPTLNNHYGLLDCRVKTAAKRDARAETAGE
jgi:hypothetical protein